MRSLATAALPVIMAPTRFTNPATTIVLSGYYPILSKDSDPLRVREFLRCIGVPVLDILPPHVQIPPPSLSNDPVTAEIVQQCQIFWKESTMALTDAVTAVNAIVGGPARIRFASPTFNDENAALAGDDSWLWGIQPDSLPQDPVADRRASACDQSEPNLLRRVICYRASAGHPNKRGAEKYAEAICAVLRVV